MKTKFKSKKYNYFYKITNNINGHFYYGIHSTDNLNDGYMGSGYRINLAYKKYGIENFTKEILIIFDTREEASNYEMEMVTEELIKDSNCYNIKTGGDFGRTVNYITVCLKSNPTKYFDIDINEYYQNKDKYQTTEANKKCYIVYDKQENKEVRISKDEYLNNLNKYEFIKLNFTIHKGYSTYKDSNNNMFYCSNNDERVLSGKLKHNWVGLHHTDESKQKMKNTMKNNNHQQGEKNSQYNTKWINKDGIDKKIKNDEVNEYLLNGWNLGRTGGKRDLIWIHKNDKEQYVNKVYIDNYINNGWSLGRLNKIDKRIWVNKDNNRKLIKEIELDYYLKDNWKLGMK